MNREVDDSSEMRLGCRKQSEVRPSNYQKAEKDGPRSGGDSVPQADDIQPGEIKLLKVAAL